MTKPHSFKLKLSRGHLDSKVRAMETYGRWFPPIDVLFELRGNGKTYKTYIDGANRLRLNEILKENPLTRAGDFLVFDPIDGGRYWAVSVKKGSDVDQMKLVEEEVPKKGKKRRVKLDHDYLQEMLIELGWQYGFFPEKEVKLERLQYDVVWKRVKSGNPVKVFEVQVHGSLEGALTKLKHAFDSWNAELFLVLNNLKDIDRAEFLLSGSFHEIQKKTTLLIGTEVYEMLSHKARHGKIEKKLEK
ncbi:MAG: hypothetical protein ACFFER_20400 [Candidatus Thorarchaeota archaeon]